MSFYILFIVGIVLIILELLTLSLFLLFLGIGFIISGAISIFFELSVMNQIYTVVGVSLASFLLLRKPIKKWIRKDTQTLKDNFLDEGGIGEVRGNMIFFKGTLWKHKLKVKLNEGEKVEVSGTEGGFAILKEDK